LKKNEEDITYHNCEVASLLALSSSTNIVQIKAAYRLHNEIRIVMEFIDGGTLAEILGSCKLTEPYIFYISKSILCGLAFLHSRKFVHRDLKANNIMISKKGDVKIIDFGFCAEELEPLVELVGTTYWMAPEIFKKQVYTSKVDIWSFGIVFLEMYLRRTPFNSKWEAMFKAICGETMQCVTPQIKMREEAYTFCQSCLLVDPDKRSSATELLECPIIKSSFLDKDFESFIDQFLISITLFYSGI